MTRGAPAPLPAGLLGLLRERPLVGEHEYLVIPGEVVEPARVMAVLQAQVDSRQIGGAPWAQEFPVSSATSCSRGARNRRFSFRHSRPADTISEVVQPFSRRCS